jgi:hypothetical protein
MKIGHKIPDKSAPEHIGGHTNHRARVEHGIDGTLAMIAHHQSDELLAGGFELLGLITPEF